MALGCAADDEAITSFPEYDPIEPMYSQDVMIRTGVRMHENQLRVTAEKGLKTNVVRVDATGRLIDYQASGPSDTAVIFRSACCGVDTRGEVAMIQEAL